MKDNKLFNNLSNIDDKIIEEAEMREYVPEKKFDFRKVLIPITGIAIIVLMIAPKYIGENINFDGRDEAALPQVENIDLPKISMGSFKSEGTGFEAFMAYDIEEIINANPWNENADIPRLPVFSNKLDYNEKGLPTNINIKAMRTRLDETIALLKINPKKIEIIDNYPTEEEIEEITEKIKSTGGELGDVFVNINPLYGKSENYEISVFKDLLVEIKFKLKDKVLKKYYIGYNSSFKDVMETSNYIMNKYNKLLGMKEPVINIHDGDYTFDGDQKYNLGFYEGEGTLEEQIINYNLNYVDSYLIEEDKSINFRINKPDLSLEVGNYPIIKSAEAEKLLIDNKYITNVPEEFPGKEYIRKVELVYRGEYEENYMPYYLFYVELEKYEQENNLNTYGAYYVPAIKLKYIDNLSVMDAKFN